MTPAKKGETKPTEAKKTSLSRGGRVNPVGDDVAMDEVKDDKPSGSEPGSGEPTQDSAPVVDPFAVAAATATGAVAKGGGSGATSADPKLARDVAKVLATLKEERLGFWIWQDPPALINAEDPSEGLVRRVFSGNVATITDKLKRAAAPLLKVKHDELTVRTGRIAGNAKDSDERHVWIGWLPVEVEPDAPSEDAPVEDPPAEVGEAA